MSPALPERKNTVPTIVSPDDPRDVEHWDDEEFVTDWAMPPAPAVQPGRLSREHRPSHVKSNTLIGAVRRKSRTVFQ